MKNFANVFPSESLFNRAEAVRAEAARLCDELTWSCQALQRARELLRDIRADEDRRDGGHRLKSGVGR